jgi:hypothetical protein
VTWVKSADVEDLQNQIAKSRLGRRLSTKKKKKNKKNNGRTLPITFLNSSTYPTPYDHHEITQSLIFFVEKKTHSRNKESMTSVTYTLG